MATTEARKIAIDEIVESTAAGVLRALDARAGGNFKPTGAPELVKAGFFVDLLIRCGGRVGPIDVLGGGGPGGGVRGSE